MESETIVVPNITVMLVKTDPEILQKLFERLSKMPCKDCLMPYMDESQVKTLMRYNVWTVDQFCDVSGLSLSTVGNMTRPGYIGNRIEAKLDVCFPFPGSGGRGPKCIIRNAKSEKYIKL